MWSPRIEIERYAQDHLSKHVWVFGVIDNMVVLNEYSHMARKTRRHKFKHNRFYRRLGPRMFLRSPMSMSEEDVPTPEDVFNEALEQARSQLAVGLWENDFGRS